MRDSPAHKAAYEYLQWIESLRPDQRSFSETLALHRWRWSSYWALKFGLVPTSSEEETRGDH